MDSLHASEREDNRIIISLMTTVLSSPFIERINLYTVTIKEINTSFLLKEICQVIITRPPTWHF